MSSPTPTGRASRTPENTETHGVLDAAVAAAYGWPADITDDDALRELVEAQRRRVTPRPRRHRLPASRPSATIRSRTTRVVLSADTTRVV